MSTPVARVQAKGQVTIPLSMRKKLNLRRGDLVAFMAIEQGILISPAEIMVSKALDLLGRRLRKQKISLTELMDESRTVRGKLIEEMYGISNADRS